MVATAFPLEGKAGGPDDPGPVVVGLMVSAGGRYDDVRMCVATAAGVRGGLALDISFFVEVPVADRTSILVNVPVMRPILFGAAFDMLQFEPEARVLYRATTDGSTDFLVGPSLGLILLCLPKTLTTCTASSFPSRNSRSGMETC